jgi:multiple sugar transport system substrate-binding protein
MDTNRKNQRWLVGIGMILLILSLVACAQVATPEPVTIKFSFLDQYQEFYAGLAEKFQQEHPFITVELNPVRWDGLTALQPGDTDAFAFDISVMQQFLDRDGLLGLSPLIQADNTFDRADFYPGTIDLLVQEGETWGVPIGADLFVLFYNKDLFDQAGLAYPNAEWTWQREFLDAAMLLTDSEDVLQPVFGYASTMEFFDTFAIVYAFGGRIVDDPQHPGLVAFNDPLTVEALEWYARLYLDYGVAPTEAVARSKFGSGGVYTGLQRGQIAMWILPLSVRNEEDLTGELVNWGFAPLPHDVASFSPVWVEEVYSISAATQHPTETWKWLSYLSRQIHPHQIPTRISQVDSAEFDQLMGAELAETVRASLKNAHPISIWQFMQLGPALEYYAGAVEKVTAGESSAQEALDLAQEQAEKVIP